MIDYTTLKQNITDMLEEQQEKLGYQEETVRLYYPLESLNHILGTQASTEEMREFLKKFRTQAKELGALRFSDRESRFCITVPPEGAAYVHRTRPENGFLKGLIALVREHGCTLEQVRGYFRSWSEKAEERRMTEEFDLLIYFPDGQPDSYYYCLKQESNHVIYHRFTKADYQSMHLQEQE